MTNKEFKRLKRADLIEIIYQMQENEERYKTAIARMREQLENRQIQIQNAGSIAEASLAICNVIQSTQDAANLYLEQIEAMRTQAAEELAAAREEAARIRNAAAESLYLSPPLKTTFRR